MLLDTFADIFLFRLGPADGLCSEKNYFTWKKIINRTIVPDDYATFYTFVRVTRTQYSTPEEEAHGEEATSSFLIVF